MLDPEAAKINLD